MKYFLDTEFLEGTQKNLFNVKSKPTIDLISIGIVCEDGRKYYAVSKDFNLKEAWNRHDLKTTKFTKGFGYETEKIYWIRDNVIRPIFKELRAKEVEEYNIAMKRNVVLDFPMYSFCFKQFKRLIKKYGKSNKEIAEEIKDFVSQKQLLYHNTKSDMYGFTAEALSTFEGRMACVKHNWGSPEFYGYYSDYDWVVFCWLFGKMINLPKGFPMYCNDLKQWKEQIIERAYNRARNDFEKKVILDMGNMKGYPKQANEHNALADAEWNYELYKFLLSI